MRLKPAPTTTTASFADSTITSSQRGIVQVKVTAPKVTVAGTVKVSYDGRSVSRTLRAGATRVELPALGPGRYRVRVTYLGTSVFTSSTAAVRTLTVTQG